MARRWLVAITFISFAFACTPTAAPITAAAPATKPSSASPTAAIRSACRSLAVARTEYAARCEGRLHLRSDIDDAIECELDATSPGAELTALEIRACVARVMQADCKIENPEALTKCGRERGTFAVDAPCIRDRQCASGYCTYNFLSGCGRCGLSNEDRAKQAEDEEDARAKSAGHSKLGQPCDVQWKEAAAEGRSVRPPCEPGTYCGQTRVCLRPVPRGGRCGTAPRWDLCDGELRCVNGRCEPPPLPGATCKTKDDCIFEEICPKAEGRCRPKRTDLKNGTPCSREEHADQCGEGRCVEGRDGRNICRLDLVDVGASCAADGVACKWPAQCTYDTHVCALPPKVGEACEYSPDCVHGARCVGWKGHHAGKCVAMGNEGDACQQTDDIAQRGCMLPLLCVAGRCERPTGICH